MDIKTCYEALGGDYDDVIGRLRNEKLVQKFVLKFPDDGNFENLKNALQEKKTEEAFRAAHTIKGMCQNLSFDRLAKSSSALTETLRSGDLEGALKLFGGVEDDYCCTVRAIGEYKKSIEL